MIRALLVLALTVIAALAPARAAWASFDASTGAASPVSTLVVATVSDLAATPDASCTSTVVTWAATAGADRFVVQRDTGTGWTLVATVDDALRVDVSGQGPVDGVAWRVIPLDRSSGWTGSSMVTAPTSCT